MEQETLQSELTGLRKEQNKARQDEVFGGLSQAERAEYAKRAKRIHELEVQLQTSGGLQERCPVGDDGETETPKERQIRNGYCSESGSPALPQPREGLAGCLFRLGTNGPRQRKER
jgi:hypothetical protein